MHHHPPPRLGDLGGADVTLPRAARPEPLSPDPPQRLATGNFLSREVGEHLGDVLVQQPMPGRHGDPRPLHALCPDSEDPLPDLLCDAWSATTGPQPPAVRAGQYQVLARAAAQALQSAKAHEPQAQCPGLDLWQGPQLGRLRTAPLADRGHPRVEARPRLPGLGPVRAPGAESRLGFQDVLGADPGLPNLLGRQIGQCRAPPVPRRSVPLSGRTGGAKTRMVGQPAQRPPTEPAFHVGQHHPAQVWLKFLNSEAGPVELQLEPGSEQQNAPAHDHSPCPGSWRPECQPASQTRERSPSGEPRSRPRRRCQSR